MDIDIEKKVKDFIEYWQTFMTKWLKFAESQKVSLNEFISEKDEFLKYGDVYKSFSNYIPEPYFGNPNNLIDENIHAVFINLNPGSAGPSQSYFDEGSYLKDFKKNNSNYQETLEYWNKAFYEYLVKLSDFHAEFKAPKERNKKNKKPEKPSAYDTLNWWYNNRAKWVDTFLKPNNIEYEIQIQHILGLELTPWHSRNFTEIKKIDVKFVENNVVSKAVEFSKYINNSFLREDKKSIVLACGAGFKNLFNNKKWEEITPDFLKSNWKVWRWQFDENTAILNFHQTNNNGAVKLNFPNEEYYKEDFQKLLLEQLKNMVA